MIAYNILCILGTLVVWLFSQTTAYLLPIFYSMVFVGFLPAYWAIERMIKEQWSIIIANFICFLGQFFVVNEICSLIREVVSHDSSPKVFGGAIGFGTMSNIFVIAIVILLFMWLGLFLFSVWCGTEESKRR